ncbi:MAG: NAD(P)-dependent oxidoreductase [Actinomycetota bacterium]|nr:NAD(P)-dependent oxidoreductase [Actinomycetota bacterium]
MWPEHPVVQEDLERVCSTAGIPWQSLHGKDVLVTGATGLIGRALVKALLWYSLQHDHAVRVIAVVRDVAKARSRFSGALETGAPLSLVHGDVSALPPLDGTVDFVVHGASATASRDFVSRPVDVIRTALHGTEQVLELARTQRVTSVVYLSSMEVYGVPDGSRRIGESDFQGFDPMLLRSSYPESKRMAEALCAAYAGQHGVPAKVLRLAQTFGPGVDRDDQRLFAQFARAAVEGRDVVLHTSGETERSSLYTSDAVSAILTVLLRGGDGEAYNAANEETYRSVRATAELVARTCGPTPVRVRMEPQELATSGYAPTLKMDLDTAKLRSLGWRPSVGLAEMYRRTAAVL